MLSCGGYVIRGIDRWGATVGLRATRGLVIANGFVGGLFVGGNVQRSLVDMPAWQRVGPAAWATFSRSADLGNGLVLFPIIGIGGAMLMLVMAVVYRLDRTAPRAAALPIYLGVLLLVVGIVTTIHAAPLMLSLRSGTTDPVALQRAFDGFLWWGTIRAVGDVLGYCCSFWAVVAICGPMARASATRDT
jgi:hypothetical protein